MLYLLGVPGSLGHPENPLELRVNIRPFGLPSFSSIVGMATVIT